MTAKEWLMRAWHIDKEIDAMLIARDKAFARCTSITTLPKIVMSNHPDPDPDGAMVAFMHIEEKIDARIDELTQVKAETLDAIETVQDSTLRTLLISRYICFKTWEQIAVDIGYSYSQVVKYLHPRALAKIKDAIECHTTSVL